MVDVISLVATGITTAVAAFIGAGASIWTSNRNARIERAKLLTALTSSAEVERARLGAYKSLWSLLGRCSTFGAERIASELQSVQNDLQRWYYDEGGGLLIGGAYEDQESTKAALFALRDLEDDDPRVIWGKAHNLRHCLRRDIGIFELVDDEAQAIGKAKAKLDTLAK